MFIKYKNYSGALIQAYQIKGERFKFVLSDTNDVLISFEASIKDIRIPNVVGNMHLFEKEGE